jgi:hypothetical protein
MDFMEAGDDQLKKLQSGETDTATVIEINELRGDIGRQLARAEEEGVISRQDFREWNERLKNSGNSKQEVSGIGHEVSSVIEESKRLIAELPAGDKEVDIFKQMSLKEKKEYLVNLRKAADDLNKRADKLGDLFPDAQEKLKTLEGTERAKYLEELNIRRTNVLKYGSMMEEHAKHFSKKSQGEYMAMFRELSISKQTEWLNAFVETQAKPRIRLSGRYEALPSKIKERIEDFYEMSRHDKERAVTKGEEEKSFADKLYGNPDHKYMASKSRKFMKATFIGADSNLRKAMMGMLEKTIKDEAELGRKFEGLPANVRNGCADFMEKDFEEKTKVLDELLVKDYEDRLNPWLEKKVIGEGTVGSFMGWFKELDVKGKMEEGTDQKLKNQMADRIALMGRFEKELPDDVRKANAHFYALGHHERMDLFERLKKAQEANKRATEGGNAETKEQSATVAQKKKPETEESGDGKEIKAEAKESESQLDEAKVLDEAKKVKEQSSLMKKRIRDKNVAEGIAELVVNSDLANQGIYDSARKDKHLQSQKERDLNSKLMEFSGGKAVAESGRKKAKAVREIDLDKIADGVATEDELLKLKNEVINNQGEKARNVFHLQFADRKSGQKLSGAMGRHKVAEQQQDLQDDIADKVAAKMGLDAANDNASGKEKVRSILRKDKLKIDLKEASGF